jgi:hypothetical protein
MANRRHFEQARRKKNPNLMQHKSDAELAGIAFSSSVERFVKNKLEGRLGTVLK